MKPEKLKLPEKKIICYTLQDIGAEKDVLNWTTIAQELRSTIDKWGLSKLKCFCSAMEIKMKEETHRLGENSC